MPAAAHARSQTETPPGQGAKGRPRLLIVAARYGVEEYRRNRDLPRLLGPAAALPDVVCRLEELEQRLEDARRAGDPGWSCLRHVEVLIALLAERALHLP